MTKSYVLMTAMPPTTGHLQLIRFAAQLTKQVVVIVSTQPHEPMVQQRVDAIRSAVSRLSPAAIEVIHMDQAVPQEPTTEGFWDMWRDLMTGFGVTKNDYIVASESYGFKLAEITGATFYPYDIDRAINPAKATPVREDPYAHFADILPDFQPFIRSTVTIFGAESTGKTTLSRQLAEAVNGQWVYEYARPYLENTVNEITPRSMTSIWRGQSALQRQVATISSKPIIIQDTDLFSTVGYWQFPHWQSRLGDCPDGLVDDAVANKSDLYIITKSTIPFESDPLRYGGDKREGSDEYWVDICKRYDLPYVVLDSSDREERLEQALKLVHTVAESKKQMIYYDRKGL